MSVGLIESYPLRRYLLDRARGKSRDYHPFIYATQIVIAALNTDTVGTVDIDTDAPFLMVACCGQFANSDGTNPGPYAVATVMLRFGGPGGRGLTRSPCAISNLYPMRGDPLRLSAAYPVAAGSQLHLTLRVQAIAGGLPAIFDFLHVGLKLYGYGDQRA